jgi:hypothetical protein
VADFIREAGKFLDKVRGRRISGKEFLEGYEDVVSYYNYMVEAYNTCFGSLNEFMSY